MKGDRWFLFGIVAIGGAIRYYGIGARSLWFDESLSASLLDFDYFEIIRRCAERASVHPPAYFVLLKAYSSFAGESEAALRGLSAALGLVTIFGIYLIVRELGLLPSRLPVERSREAALLAALLVALSPMQIELSRTARGYTLAMALLTLAGWAMLFALRSGARTWPWLLCSALAVGSCYSHHLAPFSVAAGALFVAIYLVGQTLSGRVGAIFNRSSAPTREPEKVVDKPSVRGALVALAFFFACYVIPWLPTVLSQTGTIRYEQDGLSSKITSETIHYQVFLALGSSYDVDWDVDPVVSRSICGALVSLFLYLAIRGDWSRWFLVAAGLVPAILLIAFSLDSSRSIFRARYLCFAQLAWLAGAAVAAVDVPVRAGRVLLGLELVAMSVYACYENRNLLGTAAKPGIRAAAHLILAHRENDEPIVVATPFAFFGIKYYARGVTRPLLSVREGGRGEQFGSEHLTESDIVKREAVRDYVTGGVWTVTSNAYDPSRVAEPLIPPRMAAVGEWTFEQDRWLEPPLRVVHYRRYLLLLMSGQLTIRESPAASDPRVAESGPRSLLDEPAISWQGQADETRTG